MPSPRPSTACCACSSSRSACKPSARRPREAPRMNAFRLAHERLAGWEHSPIEQTYTARDCMLYALGVGVGHEDPTTPAALTYTYEQDLEVLPTMACALAQARDWLREEWTGIDYEKIVHGEEHLTMHR